MFSRSSDSSTLGFHTPPPMPTTAPVQDSQAVTKYQTWDVNQPLSGLATHLHQLLQRARSFLHFARELWVTRSAGSGKSTLTKEWQVVIPQTKTILPKGSWNVLILRHLCYRMPLLQSVSPAQKKGHFLSLTWRHMGTKILSPHRPQCASWNSCLTPPKFLFLFSASFICCFVFQLCCL
jgi:hypothetical protein